jgi:hypothetical protein
MAVMPRLQAAPPDALQARLVEMLLDGTPPDAITARLFEAGHDPRSIVAALSAALSLLQQWRRRREQARDHATWMSEVWRACQNGSPAVPTIGRVDAATFYREYFAENRPVQFAEAWYEGNRRPQISFARLRAQFGQIEVDIMVDRVAGASDFEDPARHRRRVRFDAFLDDVERVTTNDFYLTSYNLAVQTPLGDVVRGLGAFPDLMDTGRAVESALFIGPRGAVTPLHYDRGNVLLLQLIGTKRITLCAPYDECFLYHDEESLSSPVDVHAPDLVRFPLARFARYVTVDVPAGSALFIPVGWWHHVESTTPSCSLSMANFRRSNTFSNLLL